MIDHGTFRQAGGAGGRGRPFTPSDDPAEWGPDLRRLVATQAELCRQIESLGARQTALVQADDTDGLLRVLAERQGLIDELSVLNQAIGPYREQWESFSARLPEHERAALRRLVGEIEGVVERIAARDGSDRIELEKRRDSVAQALGGIRRGKGAVTAYASGPQADRGPTYQDRHG